MTSPLTAVKIAENVYWVGAIDWALRNFHGYETSRGTTYNAYLITGEKNVLIDVVKEPFKEELLERISSVLDPGKIDYIISNHAELDHSGCLPDVINVVKPEKVFASAKGVEALKEHFPGIDLEFTAVKEGEELSIGELTLQFFETRMLHWPDSMVTYLPEREILFSQDAFGMHLASSERFDDELEDWVLELESKKYFANILLPFVNIIPRAIKKLSGLSIKMIANDHGPIWRKDPARVINWYTEWSKMEPTMKAVIVYSTMWGSTARMAAAVTDGLIERGASVKVMPLSGNHRSDIATEVLDAGALLVGSPTINSEIYPRVGDILFYLKGLKRKNLVGDAFGSYGWSGGTVKEIRSYLDDLKIELVREDDLQHKYVPGREALMECRKLGLETAEKMKANLSK